MQDIYHIFHLLNLAFKSEAVLAIDLFCFICCEYETIPVYALRTTIVPSALIRVLFTILIFIVLWNLNISYH